VSVASLYDGWPRVQNRLVHGIPRLSTAQLGLSGVQGWPIWALVSHIAGTRVYWLCYVFKEPGFETTPFRDPEDGWEDHPDQPRGVDDLMKALVSTWAIVASCLNRWTPEMLAESFSRQMPSGVQHHTRASVLTRVVQHDAFHTGEISLILGQNGLPSMDPWEPIPRGEELTER
jgi:uncharacterized damage-inducible protein DinB